MGNEVSGSRGGKAGGRRTPNQQRARVSKRSILRAARRLFVRKGYRGTTIDDISRAAKLSKGAIYFHFKDKLSILRELLDDFAKHIEPVLVTIRDEGVDPRTRLVNYIHWVSREASKDPEAMLLPIPISIEFIRERGAIPDMLSEHYFAMRNGLEGVFADGQAKGVFTDKSNARDLAAIVIALQDGILLEWLRRRDQFDGEQLVRTLRKFVLEATDPHTHAVSRRSGDDRLAGSVSELG
jgi:AcrR family transcriptional regulator